MAQPKTDFLSTLKQGANAAVAEGQTIMYREKNTTKTVANDKEVYNLKWT